MCPFISEQLLSKNIFIYIYILNEFQSFSDDEVQATGADRRLDAQYKLDESHWPLHVQLLHRQFHEAYTQDLLYRT